MKKLLALLVFIVGAACAPKESTIDPAGPDATNFAPVAAVLVLRCGSVDCHGSHYRNMRLYGYGGARLAPADRPDMPKSATAAEVSADYDAVVSLEPVIMRDVTREGGADPERLTLIRKGRGVEDHKGNTAMAKGDDADTCVVSWLAGAVDEAACKRAVDAR